jgi:chromosome partitioning protein
VRTVLIASQKGGAGKTALARNLGVAAVEAGQRTLLVDLDPQGSLSDWWQGRTAEQPEMFERPPRPDQLGDVLAALSGFDLVVIDTPPSDHPWMGKVATLADLVVIPSKPSPDDLRAIGSTLAMVKRAGTPFAFVLSQVPPRSRLTGEAARVLAQHGKVAPVNIGLRVSFAETSATGEGVTETSDHKAAEEVRGLLQYVTTLLR